MRIVGVKRVDRAMMDDLSEDPGCSYDDILEMTNLPTLHDRRTTLCRTYFNKMNIGVTTFAAWSTNCPIRSKDK